MKYSGLEGLPLAAGDNADLFAQRQRARMVIAGDNQRFRQPAVIHDGLRIAEVLTRVERAGFRFDIRRGHAVLDQPVAHHVALCARFVAALRAADNHQHRLLFDIPPAPPSAVFPARRRAPSALTCAPSTMMV